MTTSHRTSCIPVSVVVPAYNAVHTLYRAIDSVFSQTVAPAELIMVDDGSGDGTWELMQEIRSSHPDFDIKCVRQPGNFGVSMARNTAWNKASQEYIAFLDSDDAWHHRKLELQYGWMKNHPDIVITGHRCEVASETRRSSLSRLKIDRAVRMLNLKDFLMSNRLSTPTVMLRRDLPCRFSQKMRYCEDYHLWLQIVAEYGRVAWFDVSMAYLFKEKYGASGLSGDLVEMEKGELLAIANLHDHKKISISVWLMASTWSVAKFIYRATRNKFRWRDGF